MVKHTLKIQQNVCILIFSSYVEPFLFNVIHEHVA